MTCRRDRTSHFHCWAAGSCSTGATHFHDWIACQWLREWLDADPLAECDRALSPQHCIACVMVLMSTWLSDVQNTDSLAASRLPLRLVCTGTVLLAAVWRGCDGCGILRKNC